MKQRLDQLLVRRGLVSTRSQAESWIRLSTVFVHGKPVTKPGEMIAEDAPVELRAAEQYVSRAGLKLASVASALKIEFKDKVVLDVGSSTGGFTDYALQHGAARVIAVDVGRDQLHSRLRGHAAIELLEQTDIRAMSALSAIPDIVLIDVSFISLRDILPHIATLIGSHTQVVAMCKPQFEAGAHTKHKGVIKNDTIRRAILKDFEVWLQPEWVVIAKADSEIAGAKGNRERFYELMRARR